MNTKLRNSCCPNGSVLPGRRIYSIQVVQLQLRTNLCHNSQIDRWPSRMHGFRTCCRETIFVKSLSTTSSNAISLKRFQSSICTLTACRCCHPVTCFSANNGIESQQPPVCWNATHPIFRHKTIEAWCLRVRGGKRLFGAILGRREIYCPMTAYQWSRWILTADENIFCGVVYQKRMSITSKQHHPYRR